MAYQDPCHSGGFDGFDTAFLDMDTILARLDSILYEQDEISELNESLMSGAINRFFQLEAEREALNDRLRELASTVATTAMEIGEYVTA